MSKPKATLAKSIDIAIDSKTQKRYVKTGNNYITTIKAKDRVVNENREVVDVELIRLVGQDRNGKDIKDYFRISIYEKDPIIRDIYEKVIDEQIDASGNFKNKNTSNENYIMWSVHLFNFDNDTAQHFLDDIHVRAKEIYDRYNHAQLEKAV